MTIEHIDRRCRGTSICDPSQHDYDVDVYMRICVGELWQKDLWQDDFQRHLRLDEPIVMKGQVLIIFRIYYNMEFYWAYADYEDGMKLVQELYQTIALKVYGNRIYCKMTYF